MGVTRNKLSTYWWWSNCDKNRSPCLQSTLTELDENTEAMLRIIDEDADTFAQRAEMYFKKRSDLVNMVEEIYRAHRFLAEEYDQMKRASRPPILAFPKYSEEKLMSSMEKSYDSYSESFDSESESESSDLSSEIEDPDNNFEEEIQIQVDKAKTEASKVVLKLKEEIERLKEESRVQQQLLMQKDEVKREAIRQLCVALDLLRGGNMSVTKASPKRENFIELKSSKKGFLKRLFSRSPQY